MLRYVYKGYSRNFPNEIKGLYLIARYRLISLTKRLLKGKYRDNNIDINVKDSNGNTPLSLATKAGHKAVVKLLLEAEVEVDAKDRYNQILLLYATRNRHDAVI